MSDQGHGIDREESPPGVQPGAEAQPPLRDPEGDPYQALLRDVYGDIVTPGPFFLQNRQMNPDGTTELLPPDKWDFNVKYGATPTASQSDLAYRCQNFLRRVTDFHTNHGTMRIVGIRVARFLEEADYHAWLNKCWMILSRGLVERNDHALNKYLEQQLTDAEEDFVRRHAVPEYQTRILITLVLGVVVFGLLILAVSTRADDMILSHIPNSAAYLYTVYGVIAGRLLSLFMDYGKRVKTFAEYYDLRRAIAFPPLDVLMDVLIGFVACLAFTTGAIVISIGQTAETSGTGLTTLRIGESWEIAMVFGVLVGLVRAQFLGRLGRDAKGAIG